MPPEIFVFQEPPGYCSFMGEQTMDEESTIGDSIHSRVRKQAVDVAFGTPPTRETAEAFVHCLFPTADPTPATNEPSQ